MWVILISKLSFYRKVVIFLGCTNIKNCCNYFRTEGVVDKGLQEFIVFTIFHLLCSMGTKDALMM